MFTPCGQGIQYLQLVHPTRVILISFSLTPFTISCSLSFNGLKFSNVPKLSSTCSISFIPLSITLTPFNEPTHLKAHLDRESLLYSLKSFATSGLNSASLPPLIGSIITTGIFLFSSS